MTVEFEPVHSIAWCHAEEEILVVVGAEKWNYSCGRRTNSPAHSRSCGRLRPDGGVEAIPVRAEHGPTQQGLQSIVQLSRPVVSNVVDLRPWGDAKGFDVGGGRGGRWAEGEGCGKDACMAIALLQGVVDWKGNPANAFALLCGLTWENGPTAWENICLTAAVPPA